MGSIETTNKIFGRSINPRNPARTPGTFVFINYIKNINITITNF
jgi:hypothetical protein